MDDWIYAPPPGVPAVLHHDRDLVAVDKPAGLLSVPGRGAAGADCAQARVEALLGLRLYAVHRLDMDTSGLLVFATRRKAERALQQQFRERSLAKRYRARVAGQLAPPRGTVAAPLRRLDQHQSGAPPRSVVDPVGGRLARTDWEVLAQDAESSLVALTPHTGRSHQLRIHMMSLGHAILGDRFYAPAAVRAASPRLLLHAHRLWLAHPYSGAPLALSAPLPAALTGPPAPSDPDGHR